MTSAAVACPGPSLADHEPNDILRKHDIVIAVNRAILRVQADYWAFLDWPVFYDCRAQLKHQPILLSDSSQNGRLKHHGLATDWTMDDRLSTVKNKKRQYPQKATRYTGLCCIIFCWQFLEAQRVYCYGMDFAGVEDWDGGRRASDSREPERWKRECNAWIKLRDMMEEDGHELIRCVRRPAGGIQREVLGGEDAQASEAHGKGPTHTR